MIKVYVYNKETGFYMYSFSSIYEVVTINLKSDQEFTLTPPPEDDKMYRWVGTEWQAEPKQTP